MSRVMKSAKRKTRNKAKPVLGVAGMALSLLTGASAALAHPSLEESPGTRARAVALIEEEISDVTLATFHPVDREGQARVPRRRLAMGAACGCAGCAGCGGCWSGTYYTAPVFGESPPRRGPIKHAHKYRHTQKQTENRGNR